MESKSPPDSQHLLTMTLVLLGVAFVSKYSATVTDHLKTIDGPMLLILAALPVGAAAIKLIDLVARHLSQREYEQQILGPARDAVYCGSTVAGQSVFIKTRQRGMHTQVIGTTNAGKTESVILPWAIQDIRQGRGLILIDGKADRSLLDKLYGYVAESGRQKDFRLFSLSNVKESSQLNPLIGGPCEQTAERVFNAFEFDNPYYRSVQFEIFSQTLRVFEMAGVKPTFQRLHEAISRPKRMIDLLGEKKPNAWLIEFIRLDSKERDKRTSGLTAALSHFAFGETATLFNTENPSIDLELALNEGQIVYFQLPVLLSPFLGKATGKLALQALQSAVAGRHRAGAAQKFYSVFLDDFTEYLYPGFVSILNKTRSANIGVVFAHQALGDIKTLGEPIANSILTNSNLKIFMRGSDPESAEYFSRVIGTKEAMKFTERTKKGITGTNFTGDSSARAVEEFVVHPNKFKSSLGVGEAIMVVPHDRGSKTVHLKFKRFEDIAPKLLPEVLKVEARGLPEKPKKKKENKACTLNFS